MDRTKTDRKKYHVIYRTTNVVNGRYYTGLHSTDNLEDGYLGSGKRFGYELNKYGRENFTREILEFLPSRAALKAREKSLVNEEMLKDPLCLNLKLGGEGGWEHVLPDQKRAGGKIGGSITGPKNVLAALATLNSTSKLKGYRTQALTDHPLTMAGKRHSHLTKMKMSSSSTGANNSQAGTCWVMDLTRSIKIRREELPSFIAQGFQPGRRMSMPR